MNGGARDDEHGDSVGLWATNKKTVRPVNFYFAINFSVADMPNQERDRGIQNEGLYLGRATIHSCCRAGRTDEQEAFSC